MRDLEIVERARDLELRLYATGYFVVAPIETPCVLSPCTADSLKDLLEASPIRGDQDRAREMSEGKGIERRVEGEE